MQGPLALSFELLEEEEEAIHMEGPRALRLELLGTALPPHARLTPSPPAAGGACLVGGVAGGLEAQGGVVV